MFSLAVLLGVVSVVVADTLPFYGPCRNLTTVPVDASKWDSELFVNLHRYGEEYSCGYVWNNPIRIESGDILLHNTWARITNGVESTNSLAASYVREGVYEFERIQDDGTSVKFLANFLKYEPKKFVMINVCSDDAQYAEGKDQVYIETSTAAISSQDACEAKRILDLNQIDATELGLVDNCGCARIPYDRACQGYSTPSVADLFATC